MKNRYGVKVTYTDAQLSETIGYTVKNLKGYNKLFIHLTRDGDTYYIHARIR